MLLKGQDSVEVKGNVRDVTLRHKADEEHKTARVNQHH